MINPKTLFKPIQWQIDPWRDKSKILLLTGAAGGGKSRIAAEKIHAFLLKYPGATAIIGRKDRTASNRSVVPFMRHTVMSGTAWGVYKSGGKFEYNNGSECWVVGLRDEGQRENLRSIGKDGSVDIAWFEEANKLTEQDHNEIMGRMRGNTAGWRQVIYTTNPDYPEHWIKKMLIDNNGNKGISVYFSKAIDNPYNPPDYLETLNNLTGVHRDRLALGLWVQAEGAVYTEYDPAVHLIDTKKVEGVGRFICSIDFGYTNPFTCSLWYIDNDNRIFLIKQIYFTNRLVEDHAVKIKKMIEGYPIEAWITDHDAEDRATLEKHLKIRTKAAYKAVLPGIEAVKSRLINRSLFICRDALQEVDRNLERERKPTCTMEEISGYSWSDTKQDTPIKENDHGLDDMRYLVAYVDNIGKTSKAGKVRAQVTNRVQ